MSKRIRLNNDTFLDSYSVAHGRSTLLSILNNLKIEAHDIHQTDLNEIATDKVIIGYGWGLKNGPSSYDGIAYIISIPFIDGGGSYIRQIAFNNAGAGDIYTRVKENDTWEDWIPFNKLHKIVAANFSVRQQSMSANSWSRPQIPFAKGTFTTTDSSYLSQNGNQIYVHKSGWYKIDLTYQTNLGTGEAGSYIQYSNGYFIVDNYSPQACASLIRYLQAGSYITADINCAATSWTLRQATMTCIRLSD